MMWISLKQTGSNFSVNSAVLFAWKGPKLFNCFQPNPVMSTKGMMRRIFRYCTHSVQGRRKVTKGLIIRPMEERTYLLQMKRSHLFIIIIYCIATIFSKYSLMSMTPAFCVWASMDATWSVTAIDALKSWKLRWLGSQLPVFRIGEKASL